MNLTLNAYPIRLDLVIASTLELFGAVLDIREMFSKNVEMSITDVSTSRRFFLMVTDNLETVEQQVVKVWDMLVAG